MSAVATLFATGMFHSAASRSRALTSGSCGCGSSGSQKKISMSISPSAILAPICWSPPERSGQEAVHRQAQFVLEQGAGGAGGVELVLARGCPRLYSAQVSRSTFLLSCATMRDGPSDARRAGGAYLGEVHASHVGPSRCPARCQR